MAGGERMGPFARKNGAHMARTLEGRRTDGRTDGRGRMRKRVTHNATNIANKGEIAKVVIEVVQELPLIPSSLPNASDVLRNE